MAETMADTQPIRVVLVDDHALVREGVREILETQSDITVVGEAGDSGSAVSVVSRLHPDVLLLDVEIPGDEVTNTVEKLRTVSPETHILILSMYDGPHLLKGLLGLGIRGYLLKSVSPHELVSAVRSAVQDDRIILSVSRESLTASAPHGAPTGGLALSPRERDVLVLAAQALSNAQIGSRLHLTEATVKRHLSNVFAKLGAVSRIDAVNKAVAKGIISPPRGSAV